MGINEIAQIGNQIRKIRNEKGLTQKEVSKLAGISYSTYSNYENNNREPNLSQLEKIANALGCEVSDIYEHDFRIKYELTPERLEKARLDAEARELIEKRKSGGNLTNEEQKKISDYGKRIKEDMENLPKLKESIKNFANAIDKWGENILIDRYRKLNDDGKKEAVKRIDELTEIPRYTKQDEPP